MSRIDGMKEMFRESIQGSITVINGSASLTVDNLDALNAAFDRCLTEGQPRAVLDLHEVPLIDSAGLERLLDILDRFGERAGLLKLTAPSPLCADILSVTGVGTYFEVFEDVNSAVGSFIQ